MILFEVYAESVTIDELECDAPWSIDMDREPDRLKTSQGVKVETWQVQVFRLRGLLKNIEPH